MYEWRSHTAELELAIEAETEEQVFADAAAAFAELVSLDGGGDVATYEVSLAAADLATLLAEWLEELIFLADTESFVPDRADGLRLDDGALQATLVGRRTKIEPLVKAATYHGLHFGPANGGWRARVVLDV